MAFKKPSSASLLEQWEKLPSKKSLGAHFRGKGRPSIPKHHRTSDKHLCGAQQ